MKSPWAVRALPASALLLMISAASGCSDGKDPLACDIGAKIDAVVTAATKLDAVAASMRLKLATACTKISGGTFSKAAATDAEVETACTAAKAEIDANFTGSLSVELRPAVCTVNASAQLSCEASCDVDAKCDPGKIEARCEPGNLSVECKGECTGTLSCEGSANAAVSCEGVCNGSCTGTCEGTCSGKCDGTCSVMNADGSCAGTCNGMCEGSCSASCTGECKGKCTYEANAMVECDATARCQGECSVMGTAPKCEAELEPPNCDIDAECEAGCKGQANFEATCTPPTVVIEGAADATFAANFEASMPTILEVAAQGKLAASAAADVGDATVDVVAAIGDAPACVAKLTADVRAKFEAAVDASVSVSASVMVSGSVTASAN